MAGGPCVNLKRGAANLAIAASMVMQSQIFFGGAFVPVVTAVLHGSASAGTAAVLIVWVVTLAAGLFASLEGYRAAQTYRDVFDAAAFALPLAVGLFCLYALYAGWSLPLEWGAVIAACSRCALLAAVAYNAAGLWLALRGPVALLFVRLAPPRHDPSPYTPFSDLFSPPVEPQDSGAVTKLAEYREVMDGLAQEVEEKRQALVTWEQAVAERDRAIAERDRTISKAVAERNGAAAERNQLAAALCDITATRDRYQANGKRIKAEKREIETVLLLPGVERALIKALHPDAHGGKSAAELRAFNDGFVKLTALYQRLKAER